MSSFGTDMVEVTNEKTQEVSADEDPTPNIPLRQRRLPASFWQEPCLSQSPSSREITQSPIMQAPLQQFPLTSMHHPWTVSSSNATLPLFLPQRLIPPSHFLLPQTTNATNPQWLGRGSSNCCACATCLNYPYAIPRLPDVYNGLRYRPALNVPCCPVLNCTDQNCKMCSASDRWHPDRLRHFRLRAARYNALLD